MSALGSGGHGAAIACTREQNVLGEGARWDARRDELLRVDIAAGRVYRDRVRDDGSLDPVRAYDVPGTVGALAPVDGDEGWLLAAGRGFVRLGPDGSRRTIAIVAPEGTRMNDGACDPQGRFWAGTLADDHRPGGGVLYRLHGSGRVDVMLDDLTISNGIDWSPDGGTMYLVDSGPRQIRAFAFDGRDGSLSAGRILVESPPDGGTPDGMTVDAGGDLWVAIFDAGSVHHYTPEGTLLEVLPIPARQCTSCAFGGPGLDRLYVTTATEGWSDAERGADRAAGLVYRLEAGATGVPARPFRPDPAWWASIAGARPAEGLGGR